MARKAEREAEKREAIGKLRARWVKASATQKKANLEAGKVKKDEQDKVVNAAAKLGITKRAWRDSMTRMDHVDNAYHHREKIAEAAEDDADRLIEYDRLMLLSEDALPLFSKEEIDQIDASAARLTEAEQEDEKDDDDGKVVPLKRDANEEASAAAG